MIAIMIPIKPYWFAKILNGEKGIEVRKNKALAKAIQKLIHKYGYAPILGYCTKDKTFAHFLDGVQINGRVVACLYCDKVEEIIDNDNSSGVTKTLNEQELLEKSCLTEDELVNYLPFSSWNDKGEWVLGYAIHISQLEIFDKPKELGEFEKVYEYKGYGCLLKVTKAPQSYMFIEVVK